MNWNDPTSFPPGSARRRVAAVLLADLWKSQLTTHVVHSSAETHGADLGALMNRAAGLSAADVARYGGGVEGQVRRQLGLPRPTIVTHAVQVLADSVSESCAECLDAVAQLGLPREAIPQLAAVYELLFEESKTAFDVFPNVPAYQRGTLWQEELQFALTKALGQAGATRSGNAAGYMVPHSVPGYAEEELNKLIGELEQGALFGWGMPLAALGRPQEVRTGDLLRIALFVGFARMGGLDATHVPAARELAVKALRNG